MHSFEKNLRLQQIFPNPSKPSLEQANINLTNPISAFSALNYDSQNKETSNYIEDFEYDENGNLISAFYAVDKNGDGITDYTKTIEYYEDGNVRSESISEDTDNDGNIDHGTSFEYYKNGNAISKSITKDTNNDGFFDQETTTYYDEYGNVSSKEYITIYKNGRNITTFDIHGNLKNEFYYKDTDNDGKIDQKEYIFYGENGKLLAEKIEYTNDQISKSTTLEDENYDGIIDVEIINIYDSNGNISDTQCSYNFESDGIIETSRQNKIGDCWLLAGLNALSNTSEGAKAIKNAITTNADGSYSIYFKGINSSYTITEEEIIEAKSKDIYSKGDVDMLIMELAFEKAFNDENIKTGIEDIDYDIQNRDDDEKHVLDGGNFNHVTYLLTGQNAIITKNTEILETINPKITPTFVGFISGTSIKDIEGNEVLLCGGTDSAHAWNLKSIDGNVATIINPHNSSKEIQVNLDDLINTVNNTVQILDTTTLSEENTKKSILNNIKILLMYCLKLSLH